LKNRHIAACRHNNHTNFSIWITAIWTTATGQMPPRTTAICWTTVT